MHSGSFCAMTACTLRERSKLADAVMLLADNQGEIAEHSAKPWASITFKGTRHKLVMDFEGTDAVNAGEELIARLPDHEFEIPGQLVADATITAVEHVRMTETLIVHAEILMLEHD